MQKRFTRMLLGLDGLSYKERLDRLGLFPLECRRLRVDLIEVYKIMRGIDQLDNQYLFPEVGESKTRGQRFKVRGERYKRVQRGNFFTQKVMRVCNELPEIVVEAGSISSFKKRSESYMGKMVMERYGPNAGNWTSLVVEKRGGMDKMGQRACFHAVNLYDSMIFESRAHCCGDTVLLAGGYM